MDRGTLAGCSLWGCEESDVTERPTPSVSKFAGLTAPLKVLQARECVCVHTPSECLLSKAVCRASIPWWVAVSNTRVTCEPAAHHTSGPPTASWDFVS